MAQSPILLKAKLACPWTSSWTAGDSLTSDYVGSPLLFTPALPAPSPLPDHFEREEKIQLPAVSSERMLMPPTLREMYVMPGEDSRSGAFPIGDASVTHEKIGETPQHQDKLLCQWPIPDANRNFVEKAKAAIRNHLTQHDNSESDIDEFLSYAEVILTDFLDDENQTARQAYLWGYAENQSRDTSVSSEACQRFREDYTMAFWYYLQVFTNPRTEIFQIVHQAYQAYQPAADVSCGLDFLQAGLQRIGANFVFFLDELGYVSYLQRISPQFSHPEKLCQFLGGLQLALQRFEQQRSQDPRAVPEKPLRAFSILERDYSSRSNIVRISRALTTGSSARRVFQAFSNIVLFLNLNGFDWEDSIFLATAVISQESSNHAVTALASCISYEQVQRAAQQGRLAEASWQGDLVEVVVSLLNADFSRSEIASFLEIAFKEHGMPTASLFELTDWFARVKPHLVSLGLNETHLNLFFKLRIKMELYYRNRKQGIRQTLSSDVQSVLKQLRPEQQDHRDQGTISFEQILIQFVRTRGRIAAYGATPEEQIINFMATLEQIGSEWDDM